MKTDASKSVQSTPNLPQIGLFRQLWTVLVTSIVLATLFTAWTSEKVFSDNTIDKIAQYLAPQDAPDELLGFPTPTPRPRPRIGVVAGHWGSDSGAVCSDGLTEGQVNLNIANLVRQNLTGEGFDVDLLEEFDSRLTEYQALALVSIHADSCEYINDQATGFKVASALGSAQADSATRLTACIRNRYGQITGMPYHSASITPDMTSYHAFDEINSNTPAGIIETGFLNLDRQILTQQPELIARGISAGVLCYVRNENISVIPLP
jgi:N-acetylmuramoyl-L-alanine amidase